MTWYAEYDRALALCERSPTLENRAALAQAEVRMREAKRLHDLRARMTGELARLMLSDR